MPKGSNTKRDGRSSGSSSSAKITDPRFANFETDPRFRLPSKKQNKVTIDKRFSKILKDSEFTTGPKFDRYGRKLKTSKSKTLQNLYQADEEGQDENQDEDADEEVGELEGAEVDDDAVVRRELAAADKKYDPARDGGFSSSESDTDTSDEEEDEEDEEGQGEVKTGPDMQRFREEALAAEQGEVTRRLAVVNLDWDRIRSADLMALFSSFAPAGGQIEKVSIYPSNYGKEQIEKEHLEGPPKEIFKNKSTTESSEDAEDADERSEDDDDDEEKIRKELLQDQEGDEDDIDNDALRDYQLNRLRYYYAIIDCRDERTAQSIYEATDGTEFSTSANFLDLRFVPNEETFDDDPRSECDEVPPDYRLNDFVTTALSHSKVTLTWDDDDVSRKESFKKAWTGSRKDISENDLKAYLASDSEEEEEEEDLGPQSGETQQAEEPKLSKKELARRKLRAALGLSDETAAKSSKSEPVGDMEITFTPALTGKSSEKEPENETTAEKYMRKERERKAKRKEKAVAKREGRDPDEAKPADADAEEPAEDLGFDDPFFTSEEPVKASKSALRKEERLQKRAAREAEDAEDAAEKAQLELLMADDNPERLDHFNMAEIMRAEKQTKKTKKKGKKTKESRGGLQEDFEIDVGDKRFKAVFDSHEYAIDPSNPSFKATQGMKKLLEEGRKKRKAGPDEVDQPASETRTKKSKRP